MFGGVNGVASVEVLSTLVETVLSVLVEIVLSKLLCREVSSLVVEVAEVPCAVLTGIDEEFVCSSVPLHAVSNNDKTAVIYIYIYVIN